MPMLERQKIMLELTGLAPEGRLPRLKLVKYLFLMAKEWRNPMPSHVYSFVPYKFGPFSFTLCHELDALVREGELCASGDKDIVRATGTDSASPSAGSRQMIHRLMSRFGAETAPQLLDIVYARYPWFTLNSESPERRKASLPLAPRQIYTAGYEGAQVEGFLNRLLKNGIRQIIDVRANPVSRKYGFHKSTLARIAGYLDMDYLHFPQLGIPSGWRAHLSNGDDYASLFERYAREILPLEESAIGKVGDLMKQKPSVLICREANPDSCHRSRLAAHLSKIAAMPIRDIGKESDD